MSKQIVRTVTQYTHIFVKWEKTKEGTYAVTETKEVCTNEKMGARKVSDYIKSNPELSGFQLLEVKEKLVKYAMDLNVFITNATEVE